MEKLCKCNARIFLLKKGDKWKPFNDDQGLYLHKCSAYQNSKSDYSLLRETITRVSAIEKSVTAIQSILKGIVQ